MHVIGKDILRFHAVYWPAFLMSAGIELPKRVFSHGFVLSKGEKMSKSVGNVVDPFDLVHAYGLDQVRYFFLREVNFGQDGNYSPEAIANRINADLANDLGNLAQRSLSMIDKNCGGTVPEPGDLTDADKAILAAADALYAKAREAMDRQAITKYLDAVWAVVADANRYFAGEEPWAKKKTDFKRMETILYVTAEVVRQVAILAAPVMPHAAKKLLELLGQDDEAHTFKALGAGGRLKPGTVLPEPQGVFPRYVEPEADEPTREAGTKAEEGKAREGKGPQESVMLVDHHCHLDFPQLAADREGLLARAQAAGVGVIVTISTRIRQLPDLLAIAEAHDNVYCSVGTHPHNAHEELDIATRGDRASVASIRRWSPSAKRASTTTTSTRRPRRRRKASAATSRRRAAPACRSRSTRATPTTTPRASSRTSTPRGRSRRSCTATRAARELAAARRRARSLRVVHRRRHLQEVGGAARHCQIGAARPAAGRDRRAVPGARALSRQDERAVLRRAYRGARSLR